MSMAAVIVSPPFLSPSLSLPPPPLFSTLFFCLFPFLPLIPLFGIRSPRSVEFSQEIEKYGNSSPLSPLRVQKGPPATAPTPTPAPAPSLPARAVSPPPARATSPPPARATSPPPVRPTSPTFFGLGSSSSSSTQEYVCLKFLSV